MKKFVIYTGVFGQLCRFRKPKTNGFNVDAVCFTDLNMTNDFYDIKKMYLNNLGPTRRNRFIKIMIPDEIFNNYEYSLYVDYKHPITVDFNKYLSQLKPGSDFLVNAHPKRNCLYDEGMVCIVKGKDDGYTIGKQIDTYSAAGCPIQLGLYANYWIFRRHTPALQTFSKHWWGQVIEHSKRDQISLPYTAWRRDFNISVYDKRGQ